MGARESDPRPVSQIIRTIRGRLDWIIEQTPRDKHTDDLRLYIDQDLQTLEERFNDATPDRT